MRMHLMLSLVFVVSCISADPNLGSEQQALDDGTIASCPIPSVDTIAGNANSFYLCADERSNFGDGCGDDGYLLGYGAKYADRFFNRTRRHMTRTGRRWIDDVLVCLQHSLRDTITEEASCPDIRTNAFDSHPKCYVDNGFCTLPVWDILNVVWSVDLTDFASADAARQLVHTAAACGRGFVRDWFWYLFD